MNRRESLRVIGLSTLSAGVLLDACKPKGAAEAAGAAAGANGSADSTGAGSGSSAALPEVPGREPFEVERDKQLAAEKFFTHAEMATITVLVDIIIPKDAHSGSATDAGVPAYIEFVAKDDPDQQVPLRGGLRWLDLQCLERYNNAFVDCSREQQIDMIDRVAYPGKAEPSVQQGVAFFSRMRNLTASGFYTTQIGFDDLGYMGNHPIAEWTGVPVDVLKHYGMENV